MKMSNRRGMALPIVLMGIGVMTAILAFTLNRSVLQLEQAEVEKSAKAVEVETESNFHRIRHSVTTEINKWIQVKSRYDASGGDETFAKSGLDTEDKNAASPVFAPEPSFPSQVFEAFDEAKPESLTYSVTCLENCDPTQSYPKRFSIDVSNMNSDGSFASVQGVIEINPIRLNAYSSLATGMTREEIAFGPGYHEQVGLFWDYSTIEEIEGEDFEPRKIRIVNPEGTSLTFKKLLTNTTSEHLIFGMEGGAFTSTGTGQFNVVNGFLSGVSPQNTLETSFSDLSQEASTLSNPDRDDPPDECIVRMGCDGGDCELEFRETFFDNDGNIEDEVVIHAEKTPNPGTVIYSRADSCQIDTLDGSGDVIEYGENSVTLIADGRFELLASLKHKEGADRGTVGLVSLSDHAVVLTENTRTRDGATLGELYRGEKPPPTEPFDHPSFEIEAALLSAAPRTQQNDDPAKAPLHISPEVFNTDAERHFGQLRTDGPSWGTELPITALYYSSGSQRGQVAAGFKEKISEYNRRWASNPPPGFALESSADHTSTVVSLSHSSSTPESLFSQMKAELGIE